MPKPIDPRLPDGPTDSEQQMLELVYDRFSAVLERDPAAARRLVTELADVTARYAVRFSESRAA